MANNNGLIMQGDIQFFLNGKNQLEPDAAVSST